MGNRGGRPRRSTGGPPANLLAMIALAAGAVLVVLAIIQGVQQLGG